MAIHRCVSGPGPLLHVELRLACIHARVVQRSLHVFAFLKDPQACGAGAAHVTAQEYHPIVSGHPRLAALHPQEVAREFLAGGLKPFDFAASYSSIEHSGLGRYGDPLDPNADLTEVTTRICCKA